MHSLEILRRLNDDAAERELAQRNAHLLHSGWNWLPGHDGRLGWSAPWEPRHELWYSGQQAEAIQRWSAATGERRTPTCDELDAFERGETLPNVMRAVYLNGNRLNPVVCHDESEACDVAVERDRPIYARVANTGSLLHVFPSRAYDIVGETPS